MILRKITLFFIFIAVIFLCGCINMENSLTIRKDGTCKDSIRLKVSGLLANVMSEQYNNELAVFTSEGYTTKMEKTSDGAVLNISKEFKSLAEFVSSKRFDAMSGSFVKNEGSVKFENINFWIYKRMSYTEKVLPASYNDSAKNLLNKLTGRTRTVTLPYPIVRSNADSINKETNTAVWHMTTENASTLQELKVVASEWNYLLILIVSSIVLLIIFIIGRNSR